MAIKCIKARLAGCILVCSYGGCITIARSPSRGRLRGFSNLNEQTWTERNNSNEVKMKKWQIGLIVAWIVLSPLVMPFVAGYDWLTFKERFYLRWYRETKCRTEAMYSPAEANLECLIESYGKPYDVAYINKAFVIPGNQPRKPVPFNVEAWWDSIRHKDDNKVWRYIEMAWRDQ